MSIQDIIQSEIQKAAAKKKQEAAASTVATQKWSTTTPTVTETPKVTSTPKPTQSITTPTQTTPVTSQIQTRQQQAKAQRQEELQQPTEPNLFQKAKTAFMWESNLSNINLFAAATPIAPAVIAAKSLESLKESDVWQTVQLATQSVKEWKTTVKDLFKQWAQSTYYWMLSYWTQFDKWLAWEALYRLQKVNPRMYEEFKKVWITEEAINNMFNDMQTYFDTQTKWWKRVTKLQEGWISLADALAHWDVQSAIDLIWNQAWQMMPIIAWWVAWWWMWAFGMSFPVMAQESIDDYMNDPSITMNVSDWAIRNAALWAGALKAAIESLDTMFEFFWFGKWVPVKKWVMESLIKHKFTSMWTEALEEMAQYEIDEIVAKLLGSDRDWTSFWELVKDVWFEAALYSLFFPTWTVKWINQKSINKMYEEIEAKIREDIPDATPEQVQEIAKNIVERIFSEEKEEEKEATEEERLLSEALTLTQERTDTNSKLTELIDNNWDIEEISDLELKLKDIETKLQDIDTKIWEVQQQQTKEEELPAQPKEEQQLPKEEWWENLSEQTMSEVRVPDTWNDFELFYEAIKLPNNNILDKYTKVQLMKIRDEAQVMSKSADKELSKKLKWVVSIVDKYLEDLYKKELAEQTTQTTQTTQTKKTTPSDAELTFDEYWKKYEKQYKADGDDIADALRDWTLLKVDSELSRHLIWLSDANIRKIENNLTDEQIQKINRVFAMVSTALWIDFNLVLKWKKFWLSITSSNIPWKWPFTQWYMKRKDKKFLNKLLDAAVVITLKDWEVQAASTLAHELSHLVDVSWAFDTKNNPTYVKWKYTEYVSLLDWSKPWKLDSKRDTYKRTKHAKLLWKPQNTKTEKYWREPTEVWARYNQQYMAYLYDEELFDKMANENDIYNDNAKFWTREEFGKLLPEFYKIYEEQLPQYKLAEWNQFYWDVMTKLDEAKAQWKFLSDREWMQDIRENHPWFEDDIHKEILDMEKRYVQLKSEIDWLSWEIWDDMRKWYEWELSELQTNYDMLVKLKEDYIKIKKNTPQQKKQFTDLVNIMSDNVGEILTATQDIQQEWKIIDDATEQEPKTEITEEWEDWEEWQLDKQVDKVINNVEKSVDKMVKDKEKRERIKWVWQWIKDVFTPALSRLYSISPRLAWAVHTYEARKELLTLLYKKKTLEFAKALDKLKKKSPEKYKKLSLALFDYWMVDDIDIKEALKEAWIDPEIFNDVAVTLQQIAQRYKDAWLDITINDKYFPRKVKDYWLLLDYLSRKTWTDIKDKRKSLLNYIEEVNNDPNLSEWEKEQKIHSKLINEFTKPSERSNNAKERKLVLSEWLLTEDEKKQWYVNDITDFYEDPIKSLEMYIDDMVKKTELKKMLWWLTDSWKAISEDFETSVSWILMDMVDRWELTKEKADEAAYTIKSIINVKPSGDLISMIKNATYSLTIANYLSAAQQLEDISKTLLKWPTWFKNVIKAIIWKAWIKMDDTWLTNAFAQLDKWWITEFNFKFSWFNMVDALGKNSFLNTAYDSCRKQANSKKRWKLLYHRLTSMYWQEMWEKMFNDYKEWKLKDWEVFNMDLMVDLLYQLWSTQPVYQSAMPTAYLNNPWVRVFYCLYSFSIKQVDWLIQWTKEVYNNQLILWHSKWTAATVATMWCIRATIVIALISSMVTDLINTIKWDEEETVLWKLLNEWWEEALKQLWWNSFYWALRIFSLSRYDRDIFKREWIEWVLMNKLSPASLSILNDFVKIWLWKKDVDDLWKYWPLFIKPLYYIFKNKGMLPEYKLPRWDKKKDWKDEWWWEDNEEWNWEWWDEWDWKDEEEWNWEE